jgi:hypothetical protein
MVAFSAGAVLTAANLNTAFNALIIRTVTGVSDTLVLDDNGGAVSYSNAAATTSTIPPNSSVAFAVGTKIVLINLGAGVVTLTAGAGVTVNGATLTLAQNAGGTCIKTATNTWSFLPFSSGVGAANFSDAATGTYTGFKYKTFTASGTLTVTTAGFADLIIIGGGGGGGGQYNGGGGGAGGVLILTDAYLPASTLTVDVGAGGAGGPTGARTGTSGTTTRIGSYYAVGGGASTGRSTFKAQIGGSGGGGPGESIAPINTGGAGVSSQGFAGGTGQPVTTGAAGGGGASAVGANGSGNTGGNGGAGTASTIAGTTPSGAYVAGSYTFGGGGGGVGTGGAGTATNGGGNGGTNGAAGTANKGGGGGGGGVLGTGAGGNGGSGLVIVRVAV